MFKSKSTSGGGQTNSNLTNIWEEFYRKWPSDKNLNTIQQERKKGVRELQYHTEEAKKKKPKRF